MLLFILTNTEFNNMIILSSCLHELQGAGVLAAR